MTREEIQGFLLMVAVGIISISLALIGGPDGSSWAGLAYLLIFPLQTANGYLMNARRKKLMKLSEKVLCTSQPPHHQPRHGNVDERLAGLGKPLVVLA